MDISGGYGGTFWVYTHTTLASIAALAAGLPVSGRRRTLGLAASSLTVIAETLIIPQWRDWPPFFSYLLTGSLGVGILTDTDDRRE